MPARVPVKPTALSESASSLLAAVQTFSMERVTASLSPEEKPRAVLLQEAWGARRGRRGRPVCLVIAGPLFCRLRRAESAFSQGLLFLDPRPARGRLLNLFTVRSCSVPRSFAETFEDAVGIDIKTDFDPRHVVRRGAECLQRLNCPEQPVGFGSHRPFALVDLHSHGGFDCRRPCARPFSSRWGSSCAVLDKLCRRFRPASRLFPSESGVTSKSRTSHLAGEHAALDRRRRQRPRPRPG